MLSVSAEVRAPGQQPGSRPALSFFSLTTSSGSTLRIAGDTATADSTPPRAQGRVAVNQDSVDRARDTSSRSGVSVVGHRHGTSSESRLATVAEGSSSVRESLSRHHRQDQERPRAGHVAVAGHDVQTRQRQSRPATTVVAATLPGAEPA